jgi:hypothetical protein
MDYQTAVECYIEMLQNGRFKGGALELLWSEVQTSPALRGDERKELLQALKQIEETRSFGNSAAVETIWVVLEQHDGFQKEWATVCIDRLQGKRPR